jgi:hypothetical protein
MTCPAPRHAGGWSPKTQPIWQGVNAPTKGPRTVSLICPTNGGSRSDPHDGESVSRAVGKLSCMVGLDKEADGEVRQKPLLQPPLNHREAAECQPSQGRRPATQF